MAEDIMTVSEGSMFRVSKPGLEPYKYKVRYIDGKYYTKVVLYLDMVD